MDYEPGRPRNGDANSTYRSIDPVGQMADNRAITADFSSVLRHFGILAVIFRGQPSRYLSALSLK